MTSLRRSSARAGDPAQAATLRRLTLLVGAAVLIDTAFYAVIAPLLPQLTHELHLSKLGAGVLAACYPAGMLVASIPGGVLAVRWGPRATVCTGLVLLAASTLAFGLLDSALGLTVARFVEGVAGACSWAGGVAWLVEAAPVERRGVTIGQAVGAAVGGAMAGPAIGAIASVTGRAALFAGLAGIALALAVLTALVPSGAPAGAPDGRDVAHLPAGQPAQGLRAMAPFLRDGESLMAMWLMALPAIASGLLTVLGSLQLHHLGASATEIGAAFVVAAAFETAVSPAVGRASDRFGRIRPMQVGLAVVALALASFSLAGSTLALAIVVILVATGLATFWAPSMALMSDAADRLGIEQGLGVAMANLAWAAGQIVGAAGSGAAAKVGGNAVPTLATAAVCAVTLVLAGRLNRRWVG